MTSIELSLAILGLLITPGPTNTLMFVAGSERGAAKALRLIPAELAGYLTTVLPLTLAGAHLLNGLPHARAAIALLAGLWVAVLAVRLWRLPDVAAGTPSVGARTVFFTTLLNPKALIFGLVLLPAPTGLALNLANFSAQVVLVACLWITGGALLAGRKDQPARQMLIIRRVASVWLGALSVVLVLRGLGA